MSGKARKMHNLRLLGLLLIFTVFTNVVIGLAVDLLESEHCVEKLIDLITLREVKVSSKHAGNYQEEGNITILRRLRKSIQDMKLLSQRRNQILDKWRLA